MEAKGQSWKKGALMEREEGQGEASDRFFHRCLG
jgi:hypothetical protein